MSVPVPSINNNGTPAALLEHYQQSVNYVAYALRIIRPDENYLAITSLDQDVVITDPVLYGTVPYIANTGMTISSFENQVGYAVGNFEVDTLNVNQTFTRLDIAKGLWDNATYKLFRFNWVTALAGGMEESDCELMSAGTLGEITLSDNSVKIECRDFRQYLQQPIGSKTSKICQWRLGSTARVNGGLCNVDLNNPLYYQNGSVAAVYNNASFNTWATLNDTDPPDWESGRVEWLTGDNAGLVSIISRCVFKTASVSKDITLSLNAPAAIQVGDTFKIVTGCKGRLDDDCKVRFNNVLNFGGQPHIPVSSNLTKGYK